MRPDPDVLDYLNLKAHKAHTGIVGFLMPKTTIRYYSFLLWVSIHSPSLCFFEGIFC